VFPRVGDGLGRNNSIIILSLKSYHNLPLLRLIQFEHSPVCYVVQNSLLRKGGRKHSKKMAPPSEIEKKTKVS